MTNKTMIQRGLVVLTQEDSEATCASRTFVCAGSIQEAIQAVCTESNQLEFVSSELVANEFDDTTLVLSSISEDDTKNHVYCITITGQLGDDEEDAFSILKDATDDYHGCCGKCGGDGSCHTDTDEDDFGDGEESDDTEGTIVLDQGESEQGWGYDDTVDGQDDDNDVEQDDEDDEGHTADRQIFFIAPNVNTVVNSLSELGFWEHEILHVERISALTDQVVILVTNSEAKDES